MRDDVSRVFMNTNEHAETVTFTPLNGPPRSIDAIVYDLGMQRVYGTGHVYQSHQIIVSTAKSDTDGIDAIARGDVATWNSRDWGNPEYVGSGAGRIAVRFNRQEVEAVRPGRRGPL